MDTGAGCFENHGTAMTTIEPYYFIWAGIGDRDNEDIHDQQEITQNNENKSKSKNKNQIEHKSQVKSRRDLT